MQATNWRAEQAIRPAVVTRKAWGGVVGLGESAHSTHEQFTLKHRAVRLLTERVGFRTLAWEENWGSGVAIDRYVVAGEGDPGSLVAAMSSVWRSEEMLELVRWMRAYNLAHDDKVRFLGTDLTQLQQLLFDEIVQYVSDVAPQRLEELASHLDPLRLGATPEEHIGWYLQQPDKQPYVDHARAVHELVLGLAPGPSQIDRESALQHARTLVGFYEYYAPRCSTRATGSWPTRSPGGSGARSTGSRTGRQTSTPRRARG